MTNQKWNKYPKHENNMTYTKHSMSVTNMSGTILSNTCRNKEYGTQCGSPRITSPCWMLHYQNMMMMKFHHVIEMANDAHYPAWSEWFHFATLQYTETTAQKLGEGKTAEIDDRELWKRNIKTITWQVTVKSWNENMWYICCCSQLNRKLWSALQRSRYHQAQPS